MLKCLIKRYIIFIDQNNRLLIKMLIQKFGKRLQRAVQYIITHLIMSICKCCQHSVLFPVTVR